MSNFHKHGVSFEAAVRVFADPFALTRVDRIEGGEQCWQIIGTIGTGLLLVLVAHTTGDVEEWGQTVEVIRIISARRAGGKERRRYEQETR